MTQVPALSVESTWWSIRCCSVRGTQVLIAARRTPQRSLLGWVAGQWRNKVFCNGLEETCRRHSL